MKALIILVLLSFSLSNVYGLDFEQARTLGIVVEQADGYVKAAKPEGKAIANKVNAKRKEVYQRIAKKTGTDLKIVGAQAAKKIQAKLKN